MHEWELTKGAISDYSKLIKLLPENQRCFHVHGSFGDVYIQCAALKELIEWCGQLSIIVDPRYKRLVEHVFEGRARIIYADGPYVNNLLAQLGVFSSQNLLPTRMLPTVYPMIPECILSGALQYSDFIRVVTDTRATGPFPQIENQKILNREALNILEMADAPVGRTILICADNNSQRELPEDFWRLVIASSIEVGLTPCLNEAGNLSSEGAKLLSDNNIKRLKVPPHLAVTLPSLAGSYVCGTNGFATIQALFNHSVRGIHFINGFILKDDMIPDKYGNEIPLSRFFHGNCYHGEFVGTQIEAVAQSDMDRKCLEKMFSDTFGLAL